MNDPDDGEFLRTTLRYTIGNSCGTPLGFLFDDGANQWDWFLDSWTELDMAGLKLLMSPATAEALDTLGFAITRTHDRQGWQKTVTISDVTYGLEIWSLLPDGEIYGIPADIVIDSSGSWREQVRARDRECFRVYNFL